MDLEGGFSKRVIAILTSSAVILALLGWAFTLGVSYADISYIGKEVDRMKTDSRELVDQIQDLSVRTSKQELLMQAANETLKDILTDIRDARKEMRDTRDLLRETPKELAPRGQHP